MSALVATHRSLTRWSLHSRVPPRCILRLEHIAEFLGIETRAGKTNSGGRSVHEFREVNRHPDDEAKANEPDENIFDDDESTAGTPAWAAALLAKLDALPKATTELLMGEVAEGTRLRKEDGKKRAQRESRDREGGAASPGAQTPAAQRRAQHLPPPTTLPPPSSGTCYARTVTVPAPPSGPYEARRQRALRAAVAESEHSF